VRVVHLTEYFFPRVGGVERHVLGLSEELAHRGHEVAVLTRRHEPALPSCEPVGAIRVYRPVPAASHRAAHRLAWVALLPHLSLLRDADVIHVHDTVPFVRWYLPLKPLLPAKPVYLTFHGHEGNCPPARRDVLARRAAVHLVRGSISVGHYLEKWYGTRSRVVTYGAVRELPRAGETAAGGGRPGVSETATPARAAPAEEDPGTRSRTGPSPLPVPEALAGAGHETALFLGRLEPDTGILEYLEALRLLVNSGWSGAAHATRGFRLVVCGGGSLETACRDFVEKNRLDVAFAGVVPDPLRHIRQSRFVLASGYLSMLEGMICRRLVFGCYANPLKRDYWEMLPGARQMMVVCGSPEELARGFQEVLENPDPARALIDRAYAFAREQTWEKLADTCLDLYCS
jgi:glycosyltransferase involved in cell wall biosynthesis